MDILRKMGKCDSNGKLTFLSFFLLISFLLQTSLPRLATIHHAHEGGRLEHQHTELQFKRATAHHNHPHGQRAYAHSSKQVDSKTDETRLHSASGNTGHDHHKQVFLGEFVSEKTRQPEAFSFQWHDARENQNQWTAYRLAIHIRGPPPLV